MLRCVLVAFVVASLLTLSCIAQQDIMLPQPEKLQIHSKILNEDRVVWVRMPYGFQENERYTVLYMTDAGPQVNEMAAVADFLAGEHLMPKIIVVGIVNTDRTRDLTPSRGSIRHSDGTVSQFPNSGGGDKFLDFLETELMPDVERRYQTQPYRIFAGHSLGGLMAIHALINRPGLFNGYIAVSPALQWDDGKTFHQAEAFFKGTKELNSALYFSASTERDGPGDLVDMFNRFKALLTEHTPREFIWSSDRYLDEDHSSTVLRAHYAGLKTIFSGWKMPTLPNTDIPVGGLEGIEKHYREMTARFGFPVSSEAAINQYGYGLMGDHKLDEAIRVFRRNVELYPESANTYDSLAEAYENAGKLDLAQENYRKAVEVAIRNHDVLLGELQKHLDRVNATIAKGKKDPRAE
jgi:predicted alpha/beta superfamily hydrolase